MATEEMFNIPVQDKSRLFLDAFAWHWHNSSNRDKIPVKNSKFDLLEKFIDEKLTQKGLH